MRSRGVFGASECQTVVLGCGGTDELRQLSVSPLDLYSHSPASLRPGSIGTQWTFPAAHLPLNTDFIKLRHEVGFCTRS